jgi:AcrR family transcriptional regulator
MAVTDVADDAAPTRGRILETALELFAAQGFAATTTRELSERMGFTKAALYYHFRSKDDLLRALVEPVIGELAAVVRAYSAPGAPRDPATRSRLLGEYLGLIAGHRTLLTVLVQDPSTAVRPAMEPGRQLYAALTDLLAGTSDPSDEQRILVRFALGGMHATLLFADPGEDAGMLEECAVSAARAVLRLPAPA